MFVKYLFNAYQTGTMHNTCIAPDIARSSFSFAAGQSQVDRNATTLNSPKKSHITLFYGALRPSWNCKDAWISQTFDISWVKHYPATATHRGGSMLKRLHVNRLIRADFRHLGIL